jgi:hypothetical protein
MKKVRARGYRLSSVARVCRKVLTNSRRIPGVSIYLACDHFCLLFTSSRVDFPHPGFGLRFFVLAHITGLRCFGAVAVVKRKRTGLYYHSSGCGCWVVVASLGGLVATSAAAAARAAPGSVVVVVADGGVGDGVGGRSQMIPHANMFGDLGFCPFGECLAF